MASLADLSTGAHLFTLMESSRALLPGTGVLGERVDGDPLLLDLTRAENAHVLVTGAQAAGTTGVLRVLATSLALSSRQAELQLILIDTDLAGGNNPQRTLLPLSYLPHNLTGMIVSVRDALAMLQFLVDEIAYRLEQGIYLPHIAVFIDHLLPLRAQGGAAVQEALLQLLRRGAESGIHLVVATGRPEAPVLVPLLEKAWPVRLSGARAAGAGRAGDGYGIGPGRFLAQIGERAVDFQVARLDDEDVAVCLEDLHRYRPPALVARPLL